MLWWVGAALAAEVDVLLGLGAALHSSPTDLAAGVGGGPGVRVHGPWGLAAELRASALVYSGPLLAVDLNALRYFEVGRLHPALGLGVSTLWGPRVRIAEDPEAIGPLWAPAASLRAVLRPLTFREGPWEVCALGLSVGAAPPPPKTVSVGIELLTVSGRLGWVAPTEGW